MAEFHGPTNDGTPTGWTAAVRHGSPTRATFKRNVKRQAERRWPAFKFEWRDFGGYDGLVAKANLPTQEPGVTG